MNFLFNYARAMTYKGKLHLLLHFQNVSQAINSYKFSTFLLLVVLLYYAFTSDQKVGISELRVTEGVL